MARAVACALGMGTRDALAVFGTYGDGSVEGAWAGGEGGIHVRAFGDELDAQGVEVGWRE